MTKDQIPKGSKTEPIETAVEAALLQCRQSFHGFLVRRLGSAHEADDVFQDFSLRAITKGSELTSDQSVVSWLYRVLNSTLIDHLRKAQRRRRQEAAFAIDPALGPDTDLHSKLNLDAAAHAAICECLYSLLPLLKAEHREVLWRIDLLGEPRHAAAKDLGITAGNLTVRLHRARALIRDAMLRACETCPEHGFDACSCNRRRMASQSGLKPPLGRLGKRAERKERP